MIRKVSRKVPDDRADEVIMQVFGLLVGAYDMVDARGQLVLI